MFSTISSKKYSMGYPSGSVEFVQPINVCPSLLPPSKVSTVQSKGVFKVTADGGALKASAMNTE